MLRNSITVKYTNHRSKTIIWYYIRDLEHLDVCVCVFNVLGCLYYTLLAAEFIILSRHDNTTQMRINNQMTILDLDGSTHALVDTLSCLLEAVPGVRQSHPEWHRSVRQTSGDGDAEG